MTERTPRYFVTTDAEYGWWKVEDQFNHERVFRSLSRDECRKWADAKNAEHAERIAR